MIIIIEEMPDMPQFLHKIRNNCVSWRETLKTKQKFTKKTFSLILRNGSFADPCSLLFKGPLFVYGLYIIPTALK